MLQSSENCREIKSQVGEMWKTIRYPKYLNYWKNTYILICSQILKQIEGLEHSE